MRKSFCLVLAALLHATQASAGGMQVVDIRAILPGASAEDVEQKITIPMERLLLSVPRVREVGSQSKEGASLLEVSFEQSAQSTDVEAVEKALKSVKAWLPAAVQVEPAALQEGRRP